MGVENHSTIFSNSQNFEASSTILITKIIDISGALPKSFGFQRTVGIPGRTNLLRRELLMTVSDSSIQEIS
jgi:hypothetical protein